jgi:DNA-binding SARP family transcriptional activator
MEDKLTDMAVLRIRTLGLFQAWRHQDILTWPTHKTKALFQILLIEPGRLVPTDQLLEWLWPSLPPRKAQNNLWVTTSQLRRVLQPDLPPRTRSAYIQKLGEGYRFDSESDYWLDGDEVAAHLAAASSAADLSERISAWEAARTLFQGDYLEDEPYAEWTQLPRAQWRRRFEQLLVDLAEAYGRNGRFQQAIPYCREILRLDNTNETAYRMLMRCHSALGERTTALRVYDEAVKALQDEIGVDPLPETAELARQIQQSEGDWRSEFRDWAVFTVQPPVSHPFVGRGKEISRLSHILAQTSNGQGQLALISGEPGIGKSRLAQEIALVARQQGFRLLTAHCYQVEQTIPYQPLIDLAGQVMVRDDSWQQLAPVWLRELTILLPEMGAVAATATATATLSDMPNDSHQVRLFQAIFHLFANRANRDRLLLVIEDIHWADPATLQCLHYLARHIAQVPIALIFTLRAESLSTDADLAAMLHSLQREPHVTFLSLARLDEADTTALLAQTDDTAPHADRLGHWLFRETAGNPFFFISLLQSLREEGLLDNAVKTDWQALARTDPALTLPHTIRDSVRDRLRRLSEAERDTLDWMAVYGRRLDFSTLHAISHLSQMTLLNTVELMAARQLLVETSGQYDFNHEKIREVVYNDLSAARRALYHRQIAEALEAIVRLAASPDMAAILAYHFERGGENGKSLSYWMQAGNHALDAYAYPQAARHFERVLALTDQPAAQMDAYLGLGRAFILQDDHQAATAVIRQGLLLAERHGDDDCRVRLMYAQAQNASREHRQDGGKPEVEAALMAAEQAGDDYHLAQSLLLLTEVHESNGDLVSALETATRAQVTSSKLNDNQLEARALVEIGFLHAQRAEFNEAASAAELGLKLLANTDDRSAIAYAWNILGRALGGRGEYGRALDAFHRSQEEAQIISDHYLQAQVFNMQGWIHRELGDYETGLHFDQNGVDFAKSSGKPSPEISARLNVCLDVLHLGDPEKALVMLDEIEMQINAGSFGFHSWRWRLRLLHGRGLCYLALDEPKKALESAESGLPLAETYAARKYIALNHELMGLALVELGNMEEAISELETAISLGDDIQYQPIRWAGRLQLVELYHQNGREQEGENAFSEADMVIQTIAASLEDDNLRIKFLSAAFPE